MRDTTSYYVYLPDTFINDAHECDPDMESLWTWIQSTPRVRKGGGTGHKVVLTREDAMKVLKEARYREEYWLTDKFGVEGVAPHERTAGLAARRVAKVLESLLDGSVDLR